VTDRDDAPRRDLGWTGPEEADHEPRTGPSATPSEPQAPTEVPVPRRVHFVPSQEPEPVAHDAPPAPEADPAGRQEPFPRPEPFPPIREPERPRGSFREPAPYAPPPQPQPPVRDPRQAPPVSGRPENTPWGQPPPGWQPPRGPRPVAPPPSPPQHQPHFSAPAGQPWPPDPYAAPAPAQPVSYAERIRVNDLVPARKSLPARGWRRLLYRATFGLINPGRSADELRQAELETKIRSVLRGHYKIGVMGKGGVGKTTVSASVGSVLAELRQDDRVVAIDADTAFGKLGSRVDPRAQGSYWELAADRHLETFADVRSRVGNNAAGLFVLAGEGTPARRRVLDPAIYREATTRLDRHFTISIVDCSSTMDSPVTQEVLRDLDALIVVSSPWVDGAAAAGQTLDWLANRGLTDLLQRTVVVLNDSDGHADKRTRSILAQQFASQGQRVIEVPFDGHLRPGGQHRQLIETAAHRAERSDQRRCHLRDAGGPGRHGFELSQIGQDRGHPWREVRIVHPGQVPGHGTQRVRGRDDGLGDQRRLVVAGRGDCRLRSRSGPALAQPGDSPRGPAQHLLQLCPRAFPRPAAALLEGDQSAGVDDPVRRQTALTDIEFAAPSGRRGAGPNETGVDNARCLVARLRIGHLGRSLGSIGGGWLGAILTIATPNATTWASSRADGLLLALRFRP
jgi:MinD-like ATPase involved in chromosome partitioning or flagellar assembly